MGITMPVKMVAMMTATSQKMMNLEVGSKMQACVKSAPSSSTSDRKSFAVDLAALECCDAAWSAWVPVPDKCKCEARPTELVGVRSFLHCEFMGDPVLAERKVCKPDGVDEVDLARGRVASERSLAQWGTIPSDAMSQVDTLAEGLAEALSDGNADDSAEGMVEGTRRLCRLCTESLFLENPAPKPMEPSRVLELPLMDRAGVVP
jgi:hypothetical protein